MERIIVEEDTGAVVTVVDVDGDYDPGPGLLALEGSAGVCAGWTWDGEQFVAPVVPLPDPAEVKAQLLAYAANKRWQVETGGIEVGGETIRTDPTSQSRITGAYTLTLADPTLTSIDWEATPGNWVTVDAASMKAIGIAVGRHVQACFSTLRSVQAEIEAGTCTTTEQVDLADWPG